MNRNLLLLAFLLISCVQSRADESSFSSRNLRIDSDFYGGNIVVESIEDGVVKLHQDLRDTGKNWFYWYFRVRGAAVQTLKFEFTRSNAIGVRGPAVSNDDGKTWRWLGLDKVEGNGFSYEFTTNEDDLRFSVAMPYLESHFLAFIEQHEGSPFLKREPLCKSRKGRNVEYLKIGNLQSEDPIRVLMTCRHHSCEMMASYSLEGLIDEVLTSQHEDIRWLRENVEFLIVPFVDKDGVEDGDQGKNRRPLDHLDGYADNGPYPAPKALRALIPEWSQGRLRAALDVHCPGLRGQYSKVIFLVGSSDEDVLKEQREFSTILESLPITGLPYFRSDNLASGVGWNVPSTPENAPKGAQGFMEWVREFPEVQLSATIEIPYAETRGTEINQKSARDFGHTLAHAISGYLQNAEEHADPAAKADVVIDNSTYRLGTSNDGNDHDSDDLLDVALEIALCAEAGLKDKLTHVDYSNHLGNSKPGRVEKMRANAKGAAERWGVSKDILFDCQEDLEGAINSIAHQIDISTADDPFFYNCTGPMEVPYRGIMASDPAKRKFAYAISHSEWNDEHAHGEHLTHTWEDIKITGINCIHIKNQDKNGGMRSKIKNWDWMTKADNPDWRWLWTIATRDEKTVFDASGTGVIWYIITGRGDELGDGAKFEKVFTGDFKTKVMPRFLVE